MSSTLVPIAAIVFFFWGIVALTRTVSEGRLRRRILETNPSPELVASMMRPPKQDPGLTASLKWGIVTTAVAAAIMTVGYFNIEESAFGFGVVLLGAGVGLLIYYAIAKRQYDRALENGYDNGIPLTQQQRVVQ
jgi:hypothetical protein